MLSGKIFTLKKGYFQIVVGTIKNIIYSDIRTNE